MRHVWMAALALLAFGGGLAVHYAWRNTPPQPSSVQPSHLLEVAFSDLSGMPHPLSEWKGKVVVVNFWATWCAPCREEIPAFSQLQAEYGGQGLQFIGIAIDEADAVESFRASVPINYPLLMGEAGGAAYARSLGNSFDVLPFSAVFDRNGVLVHAHPGVFKRQQVLERVEPLL
jgi:thiol-disulfide isomerase/thioredoxin